MRRLTVGMKYLYGHTGKPERREDSIDQMTITSVDLNSELRLGADRQSDCLISEPRSWPERGLILALVFYYQVHVFQDILHFDIDKINPHSTSYSSYWTKIDFSALISIHEFKEYPPLSLFLKICKIIVATD